MSPTDPHHKGKDPSSPRGQDDPVDPESWEDQEDTVALEDVTQIDPVARPIPVLVDHLSKIFHDPSRGTVRAVDDISFECRQGEIFGLLGANGAGKTTTLRMISTILAPSAGKAMVMGHDIARHPTAVRRSLGFLSASTALYPRLGVRETLRFFARLNGPKGDDLDRRVEVLIERFGLRELAESRVERLSTGQRQRVSIARAMAHDPPVLVLDEPTNGLDVLAALELRHTLEELRTDGKTLLFSTHVMAEAEKLCDRIAILHRGRMLACDTLDGLREQTGERYLEEIFVHLVTEGEVRPPLHPRARPT